MIRNLLGEKSHNKNECASYNNFKFLFEEAEDLISETTRTTEHDVGIQYPINNLMIDKDKYYTEVIQARGKYAVLKNRLNASDENLKRINRILFPIESYVPNDKSHQTFLETMNKKSKQLGMNDTIFVNPHGLHNAKQVTTAKDMLLMGIQSLGYKDIANIIGRRSHDIVIEGENARKLNITTSVSKSSLNKNYDIIGAKTGTLKRKVTTKNLLSIVGTKYDNKWYIGTVLEGNTRYAGSRELFDTANSILKNKVDFKPNNIILSNGNFDLGKDNWEKSNGPFRLDYNDYFTFPASFNADSDSVDTSTQIQRKVKLKGGDKYYISCMVKCTRYNTGLLGLQLSSESNGANNTNICVSDVTDGWVTVSTIVDIKSYVVRRLYVGGINSADLDGRIDNINIINLTSTYGAGNEPTKSQMDGEYWKDISADKGIVSQVPASLVSYNQDNLPVLFEKNSEKQGYPASLTKIMTAMVLLDNYSDLNKSFTVISRDITGGFGSKYKEGDVLTLRNALHSLLIESSNTMATALSRVVGKKLIIDCRE